MPEKTMRRILARIPIRSESVLAGLIAVAILGLTFVAAWFIVLYGVAGEIIAIVGLADQSTSVVPRDLSAFAVMLLAVVAGAPSVTALAVTSWKFSVQQPWRQYPSAAERHHDEQPDAHTQPHASTQAQHSRPTAPWPDNTLGGALVRFLDKRLQTRNFQHAKPGTGDNPPQLGQAGRTPESKDCADTDEG